MTTSRQAISAKQRNCNYRPSGAIAQHILDTTVEIASSEPVLEINGSYWVASKFAHRYYRVVVEYTVEFIPAEKWFCSASDERVAAACKAVVRAYIIRKRDEANHQVYLDLVASGDPFVR
jgi:NADPH-dependent ferric siderophore reductase